MKSILIATLGASLAATASAAINIDYTGTPAPTYDTQLTFDEMGGPTGSAPSDSWAGLGLSSLTSGAGLGFVGNLNSTPGFGWLPDNNVLVGDFGVFINFDSDATAFSARVWDNAGPAGGFSGGAVAVLFDDGNEVGSLFIDTPTFGPDGPSYLNIQTTDGSVFDEVRILGFAFVSPQTIIDDVSFTLVPAPASAAMLGMCGVLGLRRRR